MKIFVIDSIPSAGRVNTISFTKEKPSSDYRDHASHTLEVFKEILPEANLVFCNIADNQGDDYYCCLENHKNFNKALLWASDRGFDAIYAQVQFYCPKDADETLYRKHKKAACVTSKCIEKLDIPFVCPAENSSSERVAGVTFSPTHEEAEYVSSASKRWPGTTVVRCRKWKYTSELAVVRLGQLLDPSRGTR